MKFSVSNSSVHREQKCDISEVVSVIKDKSADVELCHLCGMGGRLSRSVLLHLVRCLAHGAGIP
jgi:hypothetical protein